jgi:hypothetical protein
MRTILAYAFVAILGVLSLGSLAACQSGMNIDPNTHSQVF